MLRFIEEHIEVMNQLNSYIPLMKIVVVGGGFAGTTVAHELDATHDVVLIDRSEVKVHTISAVTEVPHDTVLQPRGPKGGRRHERELGASRPRAAKSQAWQICASVGCPS